MSSHSRIFDNFILQTACMSLLFFILVVFSIIACSKDNDAGASIQPADTLAPGWKKIQLSTSETITDVFFIDNTGYAISGSAIFRSTNGGSHWDKVYQSGEVLLNIAMGNKNNAMFTSASNVVFLQIMEGAVLIVQD